MSKRMLLCRFGDKFVLFFEITIVADPNDITGTSLLQVLTYTSWLPGANYFVKNLATMPLESERRAACARLLHGCLTRLGGD